MHLVTYLHPRLPTDSAEEPGNNDLPWRTEGIEVLSRSSAGTIQNNQAFSFPGTIIAGMARS